MDYKETLKLHLDSMKDKALDSFISTVKLDEAAVIMPNGAFVKGEEAVYELHRNWFADSDWALEYKIINTGESPEMAYALVGIDYSDCDAEGNPVKMNYYLNLIFRKYGEKWLLVHDQNTIYK